MISQAIFNAMLLQNAVVPYETEDGWEAKWNYVNLEKYFPNQLEDIIRESITNATQMLLLEEGMIAPVVVDENTIEFKTTVLGKKFQKLLTTAYGD